MAISDSIVSYWKADSNGTFPDAHGSNDGTITGATYTASGKINGAYDYDNSSDYVTIGSLAHVSTGISYSFWINLDATTDEMIMWKGSTTVNEYVYVTGGYIWYAFGAASGSNNTFKSTTTSLSTGTWYHIVIAGSGNGTAGNYKIYVNGTEQTINFTTAGANRAFPAGSGTLYWGGNVAGSGSWVDGRIDEIGYWTKVLTQTEVTALYNSGNGLAYPFSSGWGNTINGVESPAKVNNIEVADIDNVTGV